MFDLMLTSSILSCTSMWLSSNGHCLDTYKWYYLHWLSWRPHVDQQIRFHIQPPLRYTLVSLVRWKQLWNFEFRDHILMDHLFLSSLNFHRDFHFNIIDWFILEIIEALTPLFVAVKSLKTNIDLHNNFFFFFSP